MDVDILKKIMALDGYKSFKTDYFDSKLYKELRSIMLECLPYESIGLPNFSYITKRELLSSGKYVLNRHFKAHDLKVRYDHNDKLESSLLAKFGKNPSPNKYSEILEYINNNIKFIKVTNIPVTLYNKSEFIEINYFYELERMPEEYFKRLPICFGKIKLNGPCTDETKCIYVHELTHALLGKHKGNVINLLNGEVLPIFMEKLTALDLDPSNSLMHYENVNRIMSNKYSMLELEMLGFTRQDFLGFLENRKYIISSLHAVALFDTYLKGNSKIKKEIDNSIGDVFEGEETLENILYHYDASLERGTKIMKKQISEYHKLLEGKLQK